MGYILDPDTNKPVYNNDITDPVGQFQAAVDYAERVDKGIRSDIASDTTIGLVGGTQGTGSVAATGQILTVSSRTFQDTKPRTVLVTVMATATAVDNSAGNLYLRLNGGDILLPATLRQNALRPGTQNLVSLSAIGRTVAGQNTVAFAATADVNGSQILFNQIAIGVRGL